MTTNVSLRYWMQPYRMVYLTPLVPVLVIGVLVSMLVVEQRSAQLEIDRTLKKFQSQQEYAKLHQLNVVTSRDKSRSDAVKEWAQIAAVLNCDRVYHYLRWLDDPVPDPTLDAAIKTQSTIPKTDDGPLRMELRKQLMVELQPTLESMREQLEDRDSNGRVKVVPDVQLVYARVDNRNRVRIDYQDSFLALKLDCLDAIHRGNTSLALRDLQALLALAETVPDDHMLEHYLSKRISKDYWTKITQRVIELNSLDLDFVVNLQKQFDVAESEPRLDPETCRAIALMEAKSMAEQSRRTSSYTSGTYTISQLQQSFMLPSHILNSAEERASSLSKGTWRTDYDDLFEFALFVRRFELEHQRWPMDNEWPPKLNPLAARFHLVVCTQDNMFAISNHSLPLREEVDVPWRGMISQAGKILRPWKFLDRQVSKPDLLILMPSKRE